MQMRNNLIYTSTKKALIDCHYLPSVAFFTAIAPHEMVVLESHENFIKQTYRNRTVVLSSQKRATLTVPLIGANKKICTKNIKIDNSQLWSKRHWRTIKTCYGKAPYFEFFAEEFHPIIEKHHSFLWDLNLAFLTKCLNIIRLNTVLTESDSFEKYVDENVIDYRSLINPKKPELLSKVYKPMSYYQNFGNTFEANLSVVDLIMNEGPNSLHIIRKSRV